MRDRKERAGKFAFPCFLPRLGLGRTLEERGRFWGPVSVQITVQASSFHQIEAPMRNFVSCPGGLGCATATKEPLTKDEVIDAMFLIHGSKRCAGPYTHYDIHTILVIFVLFFF